MRTKNRSMVMIAGIGALASPLGGTAVMLAAGPAAATTGVKSIVAGTYDGSLATVSEVKSGKTTVYGKLKLRVTVDGGGTVTAITWPVYPTATASKAKLAAANKVLKARQLAVKKAKKTKKKTDDKKAAAALKLAARQVAILKAEVKMHSDSQSINEGFLPFYRDEVLDPITNGALASMSGASATYSAFTQSLQAALVAAGVAV